jgi:hypothetical protein
MPLQDVSGDSSMIGWLRQSGHGHLLDERHQFSNISSSSPPPIIPAGYINTDSQNRSASFHQNDNFNTQSYSPQHSPTNFISSPTQFIAPHMNQQLDMDIEVSINKIFNFDLLFS